MHFKTLFLSLFTLFVFLPQLSNAAGWPATSGTDISGTLLVGTPTYEPSGLVWHSERNSLFTVWAGLITELDQNGNILHECYSSDPAKDWNCGTYYDFEGVAVADASSDYLYLGVENPDSIREFNVSTGSYTGKYWDLTTWMTGADNSGLEGLTYVPNGDHPYANSSSGGLFYASLQATGEIFVFDVNLSVNGSVTKVDQFTPVAGRIDASDIFYNTQTKLLYIMYDGADYLTEISLDNNIVVEYDSMPGSNEEGFAMIPSYPNSTATVFIGHDDSHNISIHTNYPVSYPSTSTDNDNDGYDSDVDCDDNNNQIHALQVFYQDNDGDGLGNNNVSVSECALTKSGYVTNYNDTNDNDYDNDGFVSGTDCDDHNSGLTVNHTYYRDADNDSYGVSTGVSFCLNSAPTGYTTNNTDCNDSSVSLYENRDYYNDTDGDTYGTGASHAVCSGVGTPSGHSVNATDCDDNNSSINSNNTFYQDYDGDGLGNAGASVSECVLSKTGYVSNNYDVNDHDYDNDGVVTGIDCDDNNTILTSTHTYYPDNDSDGYGALTGADFCLNSAPAGYVTNDTDCDDNNNSINSYNIFYLDVDGDGLGDNNYNVSECSLNKTGYVLNSNDTNDHDFDNDGAITTADCNDADNTLTTVITYYRDLDNDSLGDPNNSTSACSHTAPVGYVSNVNDLNDNPTPDPEPTPEPVISHEISISGKYINIDDQKIKIFSSTQYISTYDYADYYEDGLTEIVVASLKSKRIGSVIILQINEETKEIKIISKKIINFSTNKKSLNLILDTDNNLIKVTFGSKEYVYQVKASGSIIESKKKK